ncbi:MAG: hypothetical protein IT436_00925 [Phycisphaerales bacterium]|nr:hypothetical protein [Phycisphaerales bacterium]
MLSAQPNNPPPAPLTPAAGRDAELLKALLADRDIACGKCGYNLRGMTTAACPECNEPLTLPTSLAAQRGYGPGSLLIWVFPLFLIVVGTGVELYFYVSNGFGIRDYFTIDTVILLVTALPAAVAFAAAIRARNRLTSPRGIRRYWFFSRIVVLLLCAALVVSLVISMVP